LLSRQRFKTATGEQKSAAALTNDFMDELIKGVNSWLDSTGLHKASKILLAEPISMQEDVASPTWLSNYRQNLKRVLHGKIADIDFLPEPFAVFQYYRYGVKHPLLSDKVKHVALVIDFGGGTFDTCIVETTKEGDISASGKHSRPLAASSKPIGGYFFNSKIAEEMLFSCVIKQERRAKAKAALELYRKWRKGIIDIEPLAKDHKSFITHFHELIYRIEIPKLMLCRSIVNWNLVDNLSQAVPVSLPENPFEEDSKYGDFNLTANSLRTIFIKTVWDIHLREIIRKAIERGKVEIGVGKISVVLLSGGSSNIRWLIELIKKDFGEALGSAEIISLHEDFQEVVAKGLAIECVRRSYSPETEFVSVTYNPISLMLKPDEHPFQLKQFKPLSEGIEKEEKETILLPSASAL
jgi:hypothetical protein